MADYDYDSDYSYHSDGSYHSDDESFDSNEPVMNIPVLNTRIGVASTDTIQYQWVVYCNRLAEAYATYCTYGENRLSITFGFEEKSFRLYVDDTDDQNKQFPLVPPSIEWTGAALLPLLDHVKIMFNTMLSASKWNICTDLNVFIYHATQSLLVNETDYTPLDKALYNIISVCRFTFDFYSNTLPEIGIKRHTNTNGGYLKTGEKVNKNNSLVAQISSDIDVLMQNILELNESHDDIIRKIIQRINDSKVSELEIVMNETFYSHIVKLANLYSDIDVSDIEQALESTDVGECETDKVIFVESFKSHSFSKQAPMIRTKLSKRIWSEIKAIKDAVKDFHAYVIISEQNIQLMKIMMIPDYDTPYGGGYFEFDLFVGNDYPQSPPVVQFLTTGDGKVRFNPNLYENGKVCLSLLNTWSKPQWDPKCSTINQVILSMHSMIFVEHPYTNEPAYYSALDSSVGRKRSENYSQQIRKYTVQYAIEDQLSNRQTPFRNVIKSHWQRYRARTIEVYATHDLSITKE